MQVILTSPWIPAEWVRAHGLPVAGVWSAEELPRIGPALAAGVCAFAERIVRLAESQPEEAVVFTSTCDQLRRGFDAAVFHGQPRSFLFNVPATLSPAARWMYRQELERLGRFLVAQGGVVPSGERLKLEMLEADAQRAARLAAAVAREAPKGLVPLALVGGPLSPAQKTIPEEIQAAGGWVALDGTENGERAWNVRFDFSAGGDPFEVLLAGYFENLVDVFQRPNTRLYDWLRPRLESRDVRGIVLWQFTGCDLW
ncbi:MAG: 2-hydroxyacyl-CoA dehydratase family protein, partial [Verrucomicrobiae bacterium]|nr:2-hydroxyacyl-CoA dehydratase family protein [Verrucomicrobiae bacterium]